MKSLAVKSYAKINITLDVLKKRNDGYHDLKMIMQTVSLCDIVTIASKPQGITVNSNLGYLPTDENNLAYKAAADFFKESGISGGADIFINKKIPVAAGLAGGSGNAAAVLKGLNKMYGDVFSNERLREIGLKIGSDVPYCIEGGTMLAEGRGEILTTLTPMKETPFVLATPRMAVSTKKVFAKLDADALTEHPDTDGVINAIKNGNIHETAIRMYNVLETAMCHPIINKLKGQMIDLGALGTVMSGSGPTVIGIFETEESAKKAEKYFRKNSVTAYAVQSVRKGVG